MIESTALQLLGLTRAIKRLAALDRERESILKKFPAIREQLSQPRHTGGRKKGYKMTEAQKKKIRLAWKRRKAKAAKT